MQGRYPFTTLNRYPRLSPRDTEIWVRFLEDHKNVFSTVDYDVPVGQGEVVQSEFNENIRRNYAHLTKFRIDVVGYIGNVIVIIEVKPRAGLSAIGQVDGYADLYKQKHEGEEVIRKMIITNQKLSDMEDLCSLHDIRLVIV